MKLKLQRNESTQNSTTGLMSVDDIVQCHTLELPLTFEGQYNVHDKCCIPAGIYPITLSPSVRFGRMMPLLENVPERSSIEIHWGNTAKDTEGCLLVGTYHPSPDQITGSKMAFEAMFSKLDAAFAAKEPISIEVIDVKA